MGPIQFELGDAGRKALAAALPLHGKSPGKEPEGVRVSKKNPKNPPTDLLKAAIYMHTVSVSWRNKTPD